VQAGTVNPVDHELRERTTEMSVTERNDALQAFLLDRANKPLRVRVAVWRAELEVVIVAESTARPFLQCL
jgi:hypothetical protein